MKKRLLKMLSMLFLGILISGAITAQGVRVSGKVSDAADGSALVGVTIQEKGTTNGTTTDVKGDYSLTVAPTATLIFSYVSYSTQEIPVNGRTTINVSLSVTSQALHEVFVIGYGTVAKKDATGSVVAIGSSDFNKGAAARPQDLIVGKIPGVSVVTNGGDPTAGATIRIRGGSSLSASNDPLIVIDGVPIDNNGISGMPNALNLVNSNDIESFTVLKDASATAIYGSRASNGVIIITTKKGQQGSPMKITYNGTVSIGTKTAEVDVLTPRQFVSLINSQYGATSPQAALMGHSATYWQDQIYQTSVSHDHNLSLSGAVKTLPYRASIGYTDQNGILKTSGLQRFTGAINLNPTFLDNHLTVSVNAKYMNVKNRFADYGAIGSALSMDPTQAVHDAASSKYGGYFTWKQTNGDPMTQVTNNPLALLEQRHNTSDVNRFLGNIQVDYKLHWMPDLKLTVNAGTDYSSSNGKDITDKAAAWYYTNGIGRYGVYSQTKKNELLDIYGTYTKDIASISSKIVFTAGYSWQHFYNKGANLTQNYAKDITYDNTPYATESFLISFFGRLNYSFKNKYLLTATIRDDGSSKFASSNRWGLFPSLAFAWDIKEESFLKDASVLDVLKLRLGYGVTGQQDVGNDYPYLARYTYGQPTATTQFGNVYITTIRPEGYDVNLKWEQTTTYNVGLDFGFLKDRITGSLDVYDRVTSDLLNVIDVPAGTNLTNRIYTNVGTLDNRGIEMTLNFRAIVQSDFEWSFGVNGSYNKDKITKLTVVDNPAFVGVETGGISGGVGNNVQMNSVGYPKQSYYLAQQVYDSKGNPIDNLYVDRNHDGTVTSQGQSDKYHVKKPSHDYLIGFNSMLRYKKFDFSFNGRISIGNYVYNNVASGSSLAGLYNTAGALNNLNASILKTKFANPQYWSDYYLENGSFMKMDNATLGYNVDKIGGGKIKLRVYANVQNLFTITNYTGLDPEIFGGIDNNIYPRPRTYMLGVNLEF